MSVAVKEIAFVFHAVTDVPRARKFYEEFLGLKSTTALEFSPGTWWVEYDIAGQALAISNAMGPGKPSASLALEVADLDAAFAEAKSAGAKVTTEIMDFRPCRMFQVSDPDGNEITLHQRKS